MKSKLKEAFTFLLNHKKIAIAAIANILLLWLFWYIGKTSQEGKVNLPTIEYVDSNKVYHKIQEDNTLKDLKKENKELYDSLKRYKNQIEFLARFQYSKSYDTGKVIIQETVDKKDTTQIQEYHYESNDNDTLNYNLTIASKEEPNWYRLRMKVSDTFTIVNKRVATNATETTIQSDHQGDISNVSVVRVKQKTKLRNRIAIGPTVTYGYSAQSKRLEPTIGIGVTLNLFAK